MSDPQSRAATEGIFESWANRVGIASIVDPNDSHQWDTEDSHYGDQGEPDCGVYSDEE